jgi:hypothetical protein
MVARRGGVCVEFTVLHGYQYQAFSKFRRLEGGGAAVPAARVLRVPSWCASLSWCACIWKLNLLLRDDVDDTVSDGTGVEVMCMCMTVL